MQREGERLAYLQALGITQYVPLRPIAGAPVLPVAAWESAAPLPASPAGVNVQPALADPLVQEAPAATGPVPVAEQVAEVVRKVDVATAPSPAQSPAPADSGATASADIPQLDLSRIKPAAAPQPVAVPRAASLQRFALAVITVPQRVRLLVELAQADAPGLSALEFRMLSDILLALNVPQEISDSTTKLFRWPMVNNPRIAADASAARDGLLAFLASAQAEQAVDKILCLGATPLQCFAHQAPGEAFSLPDLNTAVATSRCLFTHSLAAMNRDGALKPVVWRQLQAFL